MFADPQVSRSMVSFSPADRFEPSFALISDERLREMSRKERRECQPARSCEYWQYRSNSHRHDDWLAAFLDVYDRGPLCGPHRENHCFIEAIAQLALERHGVP